MQTVFGFVGHMGSGKGAAVAYLKEKHGASAYRFSTMLRDILDRLHTEHTRINLVACSSMIRKAFGEDIMAYVMAEDIKKDDAQIIALDGVRRLEDMVHLKKLPQFVLVHVDVDADTRLARMNARGENPDDATKTKEELAKDRQRETEVTIPPVIDEAQERIDNSGTLEEFYAQLDALVEKYAR